MFSDELSYSILYDHIRFALAHLICFLDDRTCTIVYDQVGIVIAVLIYFVLCYSCKVSGDIFYSETDNFLKQMSTHDIVGSYVKIVLKMLCK